VLRADETAAKHEGVSEEEGVLFGEPPTAPVWICERGRRYAVDVRRGQKTGFYLDQRDARDLAELLAPGRATLDLYAHTGGFGVAALRGGATAVTLVESSNDALELAKSNMDANAEGIAAAPRAELVRADVHRFLREDTRTWDLLIVDPPPLARSKKDVDRAARAYKDAFLYALKRANKDAFVLPFSCSHHVGRELFRQIVFAAELDSGKTTQTLRELGAPSDHPVSVDHPEGTYLTGALLRVTA
jgi:23S rRNA (cytosine1962-C5)-methyltransferase